MVFDTIIRNGILLDGLGNAPRRGDLGITGGKIAAIGALNAAAAKTKIDAAGRYVTPGFGISIVTQTRRYFATALESLSLRRG